MNDLDISRLRVYVVAPDVTPPYRFTGTTKSAPLYYNIVRLTTRGGVEGASGVLSGDYYDQDDYDDDPHSYAAAFQPVISGLIGKNVLQREAIAADMLAARTAPIPDPESMLEIAMWDAVARNANMPLYRLLGGARESIPAYASTPVFDTVEGYLDYVRMIRDMGYPAVKFHTQCDPEFDLEMTLAVSAEFAQKGLRFMVDLEQVYDFDSAVKLGRALADMPCDWLEAPLDDEDIDAYAELRRAVDVDIICAGNTVVELSDMADAITRGAWSRLRCDPSNVGGISAARSAMALACAHGLKTELQSYGYPLTQAANLHLMLGVAGCSYFEHSVPIEHYEYACPNPIRIEADGCVRAPDGPGLGIDTDWKQIEADATLLIDTDTM
ncbi:MAG: mandelate racemase/muconate lactonizing enzyme family protein [Myxococcales bacterium]|nr:mandelate racemase/muconate lactonizing enzyme family protein [Myxococcales bacterium]